MSKEVNLYGKVQIKEATIPQQGQVNDYQMYIPKKNELVVVTDNQRNKTLRIGDGNNPIETCPIISVVTDLSEFVKFTDNATTSKAGVIQFQSNYGLSQSSGKIRVVEANSDGISGEVSSGNSGYGVITSNNYMSLGFRRIYFNNEFPDDYEASIGDIHITEEQEDDQWYGVIQVCTAEAEEDPDVPAEWEIKARWLSQMTHT